MANLEERKKTIKKDAELLKQDIAVLNKLVAHIEKHLDDVSDETIENFDLIADHLMDELQIVEL